MGIQIITGDSTAALAGALADRFAVPADDPFAAEMIVVPTRGIERYLTQTIADRAGISANIEFPSPRELLERITGDDDPWRPDRLVWPLLATIDAELGEPWAEPLAAHLLDEPDRRRSDRRYALARRLADLFDRYAMERPQLLRDWAAGDPPDVPDDLEWQYRLWRALGDRIGSGPLQQPIDPGDLPDRIAVFGPTRLPERFLEALRAVAERRKVELYLPVASPALWGSGEWPAAAAARRFDTTRSLAQHPLLRSLGRDARELRQRLGHRGSALAERPGVRPSGVLGQLQAEIAANAASTLREGAPDASLQIHACHGGLRQVEALREVILTLLHDDPSLQPRDILIMAPDLDTYAPLLAAVFGDPDPRIRDLRLSIADRTPEQHNTVLLALDALLALLHGRMRRSDVLDLLKLDPVHARFALSIDDVLRIEELTEAANVRWGLDAGHRTGVGGGGGDLGTWSWGMDRMALGTALTDDPVVILADRLPLPDLGSGDIEPLGRLAVFLQRLSEVHDQVQGTRTLTEWNALLQEAISTFTEVRFADAWQEARARGAVESFATLAGDHGSAVQLSLADIRHMLAAVLAGRPTRAGFRLGGMTACQLEPMRSVPYRVIALLGLDDGAFPRSSGRDGDDALLREPRIGERDPRSEDRQLLLDAIMAAEQHLIITYTGRDERTNDERHPAVPVAELLELLPAGPGTVQHHPLQPFDPRNFAPDDPISHDEAALSGARVLLGPRHAPGPRLGDIPPKPPDAAEPVEPPTMDDLVRFLKDPLSDYLRRRFGLHLDRSAEPPNERVPLTLGGLDAWAIGDGMLRMLEASDDVTALEEQAARGGTVPPGDLGAVCLETVREKALTIAGRAEGDRGPAPAEALEVPLPWDSSSVIRIGGIHGGTVVRTTYSNRKAAQLLQLWPELLCLRIAYPDTEWRWFLFTGDDTWYATAPPADACRTYLEELLSLYRGGATALLPVTAKTGNAYVRGLQDKNGSRALGLGRASRKWDDDYSRGDNRTAAARLIFGVDSEFADLLAELPHAGEDWYGAEAPTRFEAIARRIWEPVTAHAGGRRPRKKGARA